MNLEFELAICVQALFLPKIPILVAYFFELHSNYKSHPKAFGVALVSWLAFLTTIMNVAETLLTLSHQHQSPRHRELARFETVEIHAAAHALAVLIAAIPRDLLDSDGFFSID